MSLAGYKQQDLQASMNLMNIHLAKLNKAVVIESYPDACSAIRAIQENAQTRAALLQH